MHSGHRERMRKRYLGGGLDLFAPHEALELLLFYAIPRQNTNPAAHALMEQFGSLSRVLGASAEDLQKVEGIGESAAVLLTLVPAICRMAHLEEACRSGVSLRSTEEAGKLLLPLFDGETGERVYQLCLNQRGKLLTCRQVGRRAAPWAALDTRQVVENALACSAAGVILAHNHPAGSTGVSREDIAVTQAAKNALSPLGIRLEDHIIVAGGGCISLRELGLL